MNQISKQMYRTDSENAIPKRQYIFKNAFYNQNSAMQKRIRAEILLNCEWGYTTFYNKVGGRSELTAGEADIITEIFKRIGVDAWTGNKLS